jgi:CRISPR-associated endoribonuclease Cas6
MIARTATDKLKIKRAMSRLFQAFVYSVLPEKEHSGYKHATGKVFKSTNFRIRYFNNRFEINFTAFNKEYEKILAMAVLKDGLKLGEVHFADTTVSIVDRHTEASSMMVRGFVCAAIKNSVTGKKIFLEPGVEKHNAIIIKHSLQKYEALLGRVYEGELNIEVLRQQPDGRIFYYDKTPYKTWMATYRISAEVEMLNMLLDTGLGGDSMKNLGFLEVEKNEK